MDQQKETTKPKEFIYITPAAIHEAKRLLALEDKPDLYLRLGVSSGGCSGLSYSLTFDDTPSPLDREYEFDGLRVRVDLKDLMYLKGSELDYSSGLLDGGFKFSNPNAKRSCGCGSSFTC